MRLQRLVVGLLGAALLGAVPVALTATSAEAGTATYATQMDASYNPVARDVYRYGQTIKFHGTVKRECTQGAGTYGCTVNATDDSVSLYRQVKGSSTTKRLMNVDVAADGTFVARTSSVGTAVYSIVYNGSASQSYATTGVQGTFKGSRHPHSKGVKSGGKLYYRGNVDPGWGRMPVAIQKKNCKSCDWHSYKTVRTTRSGGYSARIYAPSRGRWYFRSVVKATAPRFVTGVGGTIYTYRSSGRLAGGSAVGIGG